MLDMKEEMKHNGFDTSNGLADKNCNEHAHFKALPNGKYTIVTIDVDTTGRRLIDEIVQIAAFTPSDHFSQYIMPYMNLNSAARKRHKICVISIGFYRMLKSTQTYKIIKSKSEIAAIKDFLNWLEVLKSKDANSQGIVLVYYEERKFIPYMILQSLKKYNLLDRFLNTVKSFVNFLNLAKNNLNEALQPCTLRKLSNILKYEVNNNTPEDINNVVKITSSLTAQQPLETKNLNKNINNHARKSFHGNAVVRAKLSYEVVLHLSNQITKEWLDSKNAADSIFRVLQSFAQPIERDLTELDVQKVNLERQNSFRPVFLNYFKITLYHRLRAVKFRIILAEHDFDLQALSSIWSEKKRDGIVDILEGIDELKSSEKSELADLFDSYFDPAKTTIKPVVKFSNNRHQNRRDRKNIKNNGENIIRSLGNGENTAGDKSQGTCSASNIPDSTTKSPKNLNGARNSHVLNKTNVSETKKFINSTSRTNQVNKIQLGTCNGP